MQGLLDLLAATGVLVQDLAEVFLFLPLQDAQEVVELRHAEGVPLQGGGRAKAAAGMAKPASPPPEKTRAPWSHVGLSNIRLLPPGLC